MATPLGKVDSVYARNSLAKVDVHTYYLDAKAEKRPYRKMQAQLGGILDMGCAKLPKLTPQQGTFFGSPSPGSVLVSLEEETTPPSTRCVAVLCIDNADTAKAYDTWRTKISSYISLSSEFTLSIESAWVCSSSSNWYSPSEGVFSIFSRKVRGMNKMGFVRTAKLTNPNHRLMPLTQFLLSGGEDTKKSSVATIATAALSWGEQQWKNAETRFMQECGLVELLTYLRKNNFGEVPLKVCSGGIGVVWDDKQRSARAVLLPLATPTVTFQDLSDHAVKEWVDSTMRDLWIEIVLDVQNIPGIIPYRPSSEMVQNLKLFSLGFVAGGLAGAWKVGMVGYGMGVLAPLLTEAKKYIR